MKLTSTTNQPKTSFNSFGGVGGPTTTNLNNINFGNMNQKVGGLSNLGKNDDPFAELIEGENKGAS